MRGRRAAGGGDLIIPRKEACQLAARNRYMLGGRVTGDLEIFP